MFYLILGASGAGKSRYAEDLAVRITRGGLLYVATMVPVGEGETGAARIRRHRAQRQGLGFTTIERPTGLDRLPGDKHATVLLEDVSNLVANNLFAPGAPGSAVPALEDIRALIRGFDNLIAVSYYGLQPDSGYDEATNNYIRELNRVNSLLTDMADSVVLMQKGVPTTLKGDLS